MTLTFSWQQRNEEGDSKQWHHRDGSKLKITVEQAPSHLRYTKVWSMCVCVHPHVPAHVCRPAWVQRSRIITESFYITLHSVCWVGGWVYGLRQTHYLSLTKTARLAVEKAPGKMVQTLGAALPALTQVLGSIFSTYMWQLATIWDSSPKGYDALF